MSAYGRRTGRGSVVSSRVEQPDAREVGSGFGAVGTHDTMDARDDRPADHNVRLMHRPVVTYVRERGAACVAGLLGIASDHTS